MEKNYVLNFYKNLIKNGSLNNKKKENTKIILNDLRNGNETEFYKKYKLKNLINGRIYIMYYKIDKEGDLDERIIFCLSIGIDKNENDIIINLNKIDYKKRIYFFNLIINYLNSYINNLEKKKEKSRRWDVINNEGYIKVFEYNIMLELLKKLGIDKNFVMKIKFNERGNTLIFSYLPGGIEKMILFDLKK